MRAKDKFLTVEYELEFDESIPKINVVPQDIGRVLLNIINNAFDACTERRRSTGKEANKDEVKMINDGLFKPKVKIRTLRQGDSVIISVIDNGLGIPKSLKTKYSSLSLPPNRQVRVLA
jgi:two-component system, NtrC family, sensor kinase